MNFLPNGKMIFDDIYEMYFQLFAEIGLGINQNQYLYDQDSMIVLKYKDKYIKATVTPQEIYAGRTDIVFDPSKNYNLMTTLFGYFIDKESSTEGKIKYASQYIEDDPSKTKQRLVVKTANGDIVSSFYFNIYLAYIECIFILSGYNVDLANFDFIMIG